MRDSAVAAEKIAVERARRRRCAGVCSPSSPGSVGPEALTRVRFGTESALTCDSFADSINSGAEEWWPPGRRRRDGPAGFATIGWPA